MTDQPGSSRLWVLLEAALNDYRKQTDITLEKHPLAEQLQHCHTVESVTAFLQNQVRACSRYQGIDKIMESLNGTVSVLCSLSASFDNLGSVSMKVLMRCSMHLTLFFIATSPRENHICRACCPTRCMSLSFVNMCVSFDIQVFQTVTDVRTLNLLVDLLESIGLLLKHLDIYTKIPPTTVMTGIVGKTLVELLSILALATSLIKQGRLGAFPPAYVLSPFNATQR
jgi:hypothetical protein